MRSSLSAPEHSEKYQMPRRRYCVSPYKCTVLSGSYGSEISAQAGITERSLPSRRSRKQTHASADAEDIPHGWAFRLIVSYSWRPPLPRFWVLYLILLKLSKEL